MSQSNYFWQLKFIEQLKLNKFQIHVLRLKTEFGEVGNVRENMYLQLNIIYVSNDPFTN